MGSNSNNVAAKKTQQLPDSTLGPRKGTKGKGHGHDLPIALWVPEDPQVVSIPPYSL